MIKDRNLNTKLRVNAMHRVLFICTGNSFRSPTAEALTRRYRPDWEVESAGTHPARKIAPNARELLEDRDALRHVKPHPEKVTERALKEADQIVVMEQSHVGYLMENFDVSRDKIRNWQVMDPINPGIEPDEAFEKIRKKVENLG